MVLQTPIVSQSANVDVPLTVLEMVLQIPEVKSAPKIFPGVTTLEMTLFAPSIETGVTILPTALTLEMVLLAPTIFQIAPFDNDAAGLFDINRLGKSQIPVFPRGTVLTDRSDGNAYLVDIGLPSTQIRMSSLTIRNGLRVYPTYSPHGGPVLNGFRLFSDGKELFTEKLRGNSVSSAPVRNLTADKDAIYELEVDSAGELEWTLT